MDQEFRSRIEVIQSNFKKRSVRIVQPESEFPELIVTVPDTWQQIQLAPLFDVHIGSGDHDDELFSKHLDWIRRTPNVLTWNGGDMVENATKNSPGASPLVQRGTPNEQLFQAAKKLATIQHKMLFSIPGNHEDRTFNECGIDGAQQLAEHLRVPYFPDYCLSPETRILTEDLRWLPIAEIAVGSRVLGFDEEAMGIGRGRKWKIATVEAKKFLRKPCYRIHLANGENIVASKDHMWLITRSHPSNFIWQRTDELVASPRGNKPFLSRVAPVWGEHRDYVSGYLEAAYDGEANLRQYKGSKPWFAFGLAFSQRENAMLRKVKKLLTERGFKWRCQKHTTPSVNILEISGGFPQVLRFLGEIRPQRILDNLNLDRLCRMTCYERVEIEKIEDIGEQQVVALQTSSRTFVAEGYASHNCFLTVKWRGNNFRGCIHHGSGAAQTAGAQRNSARKDMPWARFDFFWCFPAGTPVLMADGTTKSIDEISVGDRIISGSGKIVPVRAVTTDPFDGDLVSMRPLGWSEPILATPNHPMATLRQESRTTFAEGFHRADALTFGDSLKRVRFSEPTVVPDVTADRMRLYGYYLSEGCAWENDTHAQLTFSFSHKEENTLYADCVRLLTDMGYAPNPAWNKRKTCVSARVCKRDAMAHFKSLFSHLSHNKCIPESFLFYPKEHLRELLNGAFLGDGHRSRQGLCLTTTSKKLAEQVLFILSAILDEPASIGVRLRPNRLPAYTVFRGKEIGRVSYRKFKRYADSWYSPLREVGRKEFNGDVYCLHIGDPDPTFVVGQFVVHNTGHLHQGLADVVYQTDFDQATGRMFERNGMVMISPSYVKYYGSYAAKKRMTPGTRGLAVLRLNVDGRIDSNLHARGRRP